MGNLSKNKEIYKVSYIKRKEKISDARFVGADMRPLKLLHEIQNVAVYQEPGGNSWYGRGETKYYPPVLYVGIIDKEGIYNIVVEIDYTRIFAKRAKNEALEIAIKLSNGEDFEVKDRGENR